MFSKQTVLIVALSCILLVNGKPVYRNGSQDQGPPTTCKLPPIKGHCRALIPRWTYDHNTGNCTEFFFGGCDGNANNFDSYKTCMRICKGN